MNYQISHIILNQYLKEYPEDLDLNDELNPIEIKYKKDRVVLFTKSYDGWRLITFQNLHDGFVKFNKSIYCSSFEHAFGECLNYLDGVL